MAISRRLRFEILRRDGYTCRYCGGKAPDVELTVDHVVPATLGGSDDPSNLVAACQPCNAGKASIPADAEVVEDVATDALRWKRAMEVADHLYRSERAVIDDILKRFETAWNRWTYEHVVDEGRWEISPGSPHRPEKVGRVVETRTFELPNDWRSSIERLVNAGLNPETFRRLIDTAMGKRKVKTEFRYFCGSAWSVVADMQENARRLIETGEVQ